MPRRVCAPPQIAGAVIAVIAVRPASFGVQEWILGFTVNNDTIFWGQSYHVLSIEIDGNLKR